MNHHPANALFHTIKRVTATPLEQMEAEARKIWPAGAERGSLYVLYRVPYGAVRAPDFDPSPSFIYQWGNAEISRREAALRAEGRAA